MRPRSLFHITMLFMMLSTSLLVHQIASSTQASVSSAWQSLVPQARRDHALAASADTAFLFGGYKSDGTQRHVNDLWSFTNGVWHLLAQDGPSPRRRMALAYDQSRAELVLFGGWNGSSELGDTWVWAAGHWQLRTPPQAPPARQRHTMAYDATRHKLMLFGGTNGNDLNDTWEWNGTTWKQVSLTQSPPARQRHAMTYDPVYQRVILFGGITGNTRFSDTWAWNGTGWNRLQTSTAPSARVEHVLVSDGANIVLFGGDDGSAIRNDFWLLQGGSWVPGTASLLPGARFAASATFIAQSQQMLIFGGSSITTLLADTWEWNRTAWQRLADPITPSARSQHALAHDALHDQTILFGGVANGTFLDDTWAWSGSDWTQRMLTTAPSPRFGHAMVYDPVRDRIILFGGMNDSSRSDTWEWDGAIWSQRFPAQSPPPRWGHSMVFDETRGRIILFGGSAGISGFYNDTWEWDGTTWSLKTTPTNPPARRGHGLAYDTFRNQIVLFGGYHFNGADATYYNDTWEWNGSEWLSRSVASPPPGRSGHALIYAISQRRVLLIGGTGPQSISDIVWSWDGTSWQALADPAVPTPRVAFGMAYRPSACQIRLFGGSGPSSLLNDTWQQTVIPCLTLPTARIDSIAPNPAYRKRDIITLIGSGEPANGSGLSIMAYRWLRDDAKLVGSTAIITLSAALFLVGEHTISLAIQDSVGSWSRPITNTFRVIDDPSIQVSPTSLAATLVSGSLTQRTLTIANTGGSPLNVTLALTHDTVASHATASVPGQRAPLTVPRPVLALQRLDQNLASFAQAPDDIHETFLVYMDIVANLQPAYAISDWLQRGRFVHERLREVATASQAEILSYLAQQQQQGDVSTYQSLYTLNALIVTGNASTLQHLLGNPNIVAITVNEVMALPEASPAAVMVPVHNPSVRWNISRIGADRVWNELAIRGEGVVVGGIDTGVALQHPLLRGNYRGLQVDGTFDHSYSWFDPTNTFRTQPSDNHGHGTHTMGTMVGADGIGVAPGARWIAAKGCTNSECRDSDLLTAMEWMLAPYPPTIGPSGANPDMRPQIINNSWGGDGGRPIYQQMVDIWRAAGIFPAFSAGNCGSSANSVCSITGAASLSSPADYATSFATGATQRDDIIAPFSSRGPSVLTPNTKPDVVAPGREIESAWPNGGVTQLQGTSMASPHTAGIAALLLSAQPGLAVEQLEAIIRATALDLGEEGPDSTYGHGLINGYEAVRSAMTGLWWLRVPQTVSRILPNETISLPVQFDGRGVGSGVYTAQLIVRSDDPAHAEITVPITLSVQGLQYQSRVLITHVTASGFRTRWSAPDGHIAQLQWSTQAAGPWEQIDGTAGSTPGESEFVVGNLQPGTRYHIRLVAADGTVEDNRGVFYQVTTSAFLPFNAGPKIVVYIPLLQR